MAHKNIFSEFKEISTQEWEKLIQADLKGADYERKLITKTLDGIRIKPYYREEDTEKISYLNSLPGEFPFVRGKQSTGHKISQKLSVSNINDAAKKAKVLFAKGLDSISFEFETQPNETELAALIGNLSETEHTICFANGKFSVDLFRKLNSLAEKKQISAEKINIRLDFDPIGDKTKSKLEKAELSELKNLVDIDDSNFASAKVLSIDAAQFRNAGATAVQEIAFALAMGSDYLVEAQKNGLDIEKLVSRMSFILGTGAHYFTEIAKIRAARLLWAQVSQAFLSDKIETVPMYVRTVETSLNKTIFDPYVNVLRNTTEAMSALLGGTDELTLEPFDSIYETPTDLAERLARNTQIILKEEAGFDKMTDPAAGSYYIENLTDQIAEHAWALFLEIEAEGGYTQFLEKGLIHKKIDAIVQQRESAMASRKTSLLGTNIYPNPEENAGSTDKQNRETGEQNKNPLALKSYRMASIYENLRLQTQTFKRKPEVFLLTFGNIAMRKARASFAFNFFACAGYNITDNIGFETIESGIEAAKNHKPDIIVVCSSDDAYLDIVPPVYEALGESAEIVVAGYPKDAVEILQSIGIEHFIHVKTNVTEMLSMFNEKFSKSL